VVSLHHVAGQPLDVDLALFANDLLLPGHIPGYGTRDPWLLRCDAGSSLPCAVHGDNDGYPDCAPSNPAIRGRGRQSSALI
jgi:hypothetical protein